MIPISKTERAMIYKVYPTAKIPATRYHRFCPEEVKLLKVIKNVNEEAKQVLTERYGFDEKA